jgi:hypothetical protein
MFFAILLKYPIFEVAFMGKINTKFDLKCEKITNVGLEVYFFFKIGETTIVAVTVL